MLMFVLGMIVMYFVVGLSLFCIKLVGDLNCYGWYKLKEVEFTKLIKIFILCVVAWYIFVIKELDYI